MSQQCILRFKGKDYVITANTQQRELHNKLRANFPNDITGAIANLQLTSLEDENEGITLDLDPNSQERLSTRLELNNSLYVVTLRKKGGL